MWFDNLGIISEKVIFIDYFLDIFLFLFPIYYLYFIDKKKTVKEILKEFNVTKISFKSLIKHTLILFCILFILSIFINIIVSLFGITDLDLVTSKILGLPVFYIIYLFVIRIFIEEWFFRGFLVNKIGAITSSLIFALGHISYGSVSEVIGVFLLGLVLAYYFKRTNNIWPNVVAHFLYNLSAYFLMVTFV
jgi:hypothetical protein